MSDSAVPWKMSRPMLSSASAPSLLRTYPISVSAFASSPPPRTGDCASLLLSFPRACSPVGGGSSPCNTPTL